MMGDGGYAFAAAGQQSGMSLRAYIANEQYPFALSEVRCLRGGVVLDPYGEAAVLACRMADALIAELERERG